jgi:hypothetical protein
MQNELNFSFKEINKYGDPIYIKSLSQFQWCELEISLTFNLEYILTHENNRPNKTIQGK